MKTDKTQPLKKIWQQIPRAVTEQIDLSQKEIISKYMDVFYIGPYFYVIFNTRTAEMEYVSPEIEQLLGYSPNEFELSWVMNNLHPEDLPYYYHYEQSAVRFFSELPEELRFKYKFSYDYRIKTKQDVFKRVLQQIVPVYYFPEGGVRTLVIFTDLDHLNITGIPKLSFIGMQGAPSYYNLHLDERFQLYPNLFTKREKETLQYIVEGMNSSEIAQLLNVSIHTVRNHRKNILHKSACKNVNELLVKAVREGWV